MASKRFSSKVKLIPLFDSEACMKNDYYKTFNWIVNLCPLWWRFQPYAHTDERKLAKMLGCFKGQRVFCNLPLLSEWSPVLHNRASIS